jgi:hypothetical protein
VVLLVLPMFGGTWASSIVPGLTQATFAATVFFDDFEDGSATDGNPVTWAVMSNWPLTAFNVSGGNFLVGASVADQPGVVVVPTVTLTNTSIRAQFRAEGQSDQSFGVFARGDLVNNIAHSIEVGVDGSLWMGIAGVVQRIGESDLRPTEEDVILQLDAIGNRITGWAWRVGDPMPSAPVFTRITNALPSGSPGAISSPAETPQGTSGTAVFRYVLVADMSIPEPSGISLAAAAGGALFASGVLFGRRRF